MPFFALIERGIAGRNPILHPLGYGQSFRFHTLSRTNQADGIPGLEWSKIPREAPLHSVVNLLDGIRDLADLLGGVDEHLLEYVPGQLRIPVLAGQECTQLLLGTFRRLSRFKRGALWLLLRNILHGRQIK
ncbi:hypothetical protein D3C81_1592520 [compost metagenome]